MKRFLVLSVLTLGAAFATHQPASAWVNFKFGAGVNWHWQSGNNNFLWGLWRDGQIPGPEFFGGYPGYGCAQGGYLPQQFQYFGAAPGVPAPATATTQPAPTAQSAVQAIPNWYPANAYQPAAYNPYQYSGRPQQFAPYFYSPPNFYNFGFNGGR